MVGKVNGLYFYPRGKAFIIVSFVITVRLWIFAICIIISDLKHVQTAWRKSCFSYHISYVVG